MSLETKCRALVQSWFVRAGKCYSMDGDKEDGVGNGLSDAARQLEAILPQRRPKKRKAVVRYGRPPSTLVERKHKRKAAQ